MRKVLLMLVAVLAFSSSAFAGRIVMHDDPWGAGYTLNGAADAAFGSGNWSYAGLGTAAASVFNGSNSFVFLEGGDGTEGTWNAYVSANSATILSWVAGGGRLVLESAGWINTTTTLGPGTITHDDTYNGCGTYTAAGVAAFTSSGPVVCGTYVSHDSISGTGLTVFMMGNTYGNVIVAGTAYGAGYIMYSGLTVPYWHGDGGAMTADIMRYTDGGRVPEPGTMVLLGTGLIAVARRLKKNNA